MIFENLGNTLFYLIPISIGILSLYDSLNKDYDINLHYYYLTKTISKRRNICNVLLDQKLFPGVGNYLKSEILYKSEIHPDARWGQISKTIFTRY